MVRTMLRDDRWEHIEQLLSRETSDRGVTGQGQ